MKGKEEKQAIGAETGKAFKQEDLDFFFFLAVHLTQHLRFDFFLRLAWQGGCWFLASARRSVLRLQKSKGE